MKIELDDNVAGVLEVIVIFGAIILCVWAFKGCIVGIAENSRPCPQVKEMK